MDEKKKNVMKMCFVTIDKRSGFDNNKKLQIVFETRNQFNSFQTFVAISTRFIDKQITT